MLKPYPNHAVGKSHQDPIVTTRANSKALTDNDVELSDFIARSYMFHINVNSIPKHKTEMLEKIWFTGGGTNDASMPDIKQKMSNMIALSARFGNLVTPPIIDIIE
jgi:hypothetical protein